MVIQVAFSFASFPTPGSVAAVGGPLHRLVGFEKKRNVFKMITQLRCLMPHTGSSVYIEIWQFFSPSAYASQRHPILESFFPNARGSQHN